MKIHEIDNFLKTITWTGEFSIMQAFTAFCAIKIDEMATFLKS